MQEKQPLVQRRDCAILWCFLAVMMVVGSIWDYPISSALYDRTNWFGIFFAAFGEMPAELGILFGGILLLLGRNRDNKAVCVFQIIGAVVFIVLGAGMAIILPGSYLPFNRSISMLLGATIVAAAACILVRFCKGADRGTMIKVSAILLLVVALEMGLINIIKIPWGRPRMRMIAETPEAYFTSWWVIGGALKEQLMLTGIAGEEFKSFPSGHTGNAATLVMLTLLPLLKPSLDTKRRLLFWIGAAWGILVACSRVIIGAHFVTDTVAGFTVTLLVFLCVPRFTLGLHARTAYN